MHAYFIVTTVVSLPVFRRNAETENVRDFGGRELRIFGRGFATACNEFDTPADYSDDLRLLLLVDVCCFRSLLFYISLINTEKSNDRV